MDHNLYISSTSWRYGSKEIKKCFSEVHKRVLLRKFWLSLAKAESLIGLVSEEQIKELEDNIYNIDIEKSSEIEKEIKHDLMAEIKVFSLQCPKASSIIHLGCTSMDVLDACEILRQKEALDIILDKLKTLLESFYTLIDQTKDLPVLAFTHIQPAEVTTLGYRLSQTAQDLLLDYNRLKKLKDDLRTKGVKGACGTSSSFVDLTKDSKYSSIELEDIVLKDLGLKSFICSTQVYTRKQDYLVLEALSSIALSCSKFALDLRISQSPLLGELSESFSKHQVGSSAMPFKKNPINSEKINSLARLVSSYPNVLWQDASYNILERTLDDSANRRICIPDSFILCDEILSTMIKLVSTLVINKNNVKRNLDNFGPFSATERLLMSLCKKGANRQDMHESIRVLSLQAYKEINKTKENPLVSLILENKEFSKYLTKKEIKECLKWDDYYGDALIRTNMFLKVLKNDLN